jgi:hypothetical protein
MTVHPPAAGIKEAHATGIAFFAPEHVFQHAGVFSEVRLARLNNQIINTANTAFE